MTGAAGSTLAVRGRFVDVGVDSGRHRLRVQEDGLLLARDGRIHWFGKYREGRHLIPPGCPVTRHALVLPGFVDCHVHFPQMEIIGSHGEQLLAWLQRYTFPAEAKYGDRGYCDEMAGLFLDQLLAGGTTTAMVFCTAHPQSVEALFAAARARSMRITCGKVLMDRNCPEPLRDTPAQGYAESRALIEKYHARDRLLYALTPRFAPTSSPEQLALAGRLRREFPDVAVQTHLAENRDEIAWVRQLFPEAGHYLDVYDQNGLTGPGAVFAHCLHLEDAEWELLAKTASSIAFCPTSNLFLGSGLFDLDRAWKSGIKVGLATDVGGGTSLSMLQTMQAAYQVGQLQGKNLSPADLLHLATLGAAEALGLDGLLGDFTPGKEADFIALDPEATELLALRTRRAETVDELLFALMILGDDRAVSHTYVAGRCAHARDC